MESPCGGPEDMRFVGRRATQTVFKERPETIQVFLAMSLPDVSNGTHHPVRFFAAGFTSGTGTMRNRYPIRSRAVATPPATTPCAAKTWLSISGAMPVALQNAR